MVDLKFAELRRLASYRDKLAIRTRTAALQGVADAAGTNIRRVLDLAIFPDQIFNKAMMRIPMVEERISHLLENVRVDEKTGKQFIDVATAYQIMVAFHEYVDWHPGEEEALYSIETAFGRHCGDSLMMLMSSQVIATWTAFETLAGDLWEAAINAHPKSLAEQRGTAGRIWQQVLDKKRSQVVIPKKSSQSGSGQRGSKGQDESKQVLLSRIVEITNGTFDLGRPMGTLLRSKYDFSILAEARAAYSTAFSCYSKDIDEALADTSIDALNLVRNLIVHNAGIADKKYVDSIPGTAAPVLKINERLPLDGALVCSLIEPVIQRATGLIRAVDQWIQDEADGKHPT